MRLISLLLLLTLFVLPEAESRTRRNSNTVRKERSATERKIKETRRRINANLDDTRRELNRLTGLEGEMRRQDKDIRAMQRRVDSLRAAAKMIADSVAEANTRVEKLRASRADALRALRRQRQTANSATAFIFSSENFAQAYRRTRYLKELHQWQDSSAVRLAAAARTRRPQGTARLHQNAPRNVARHHARHPSRTRRKHPRGKGACSIIEKAGTKSEQGTRNSKKAGRETRSRA